MTESSVSHSSGGAGCFGAILAAVISYSINHSVGWAIFHFFCSWLYILYVVFARTKEIIPALQKFFM